MVGYTFGNVGLHKTCRLAGYIGQVQQVMVRHFLAPDASCCTVLYQCSVLANVITQSPKVNLSAYS